MARNKLFVFMEQLENSVNEARFGSAPRDLTDEDFVDWDISIQNRKPTLQNKEHAIQAIRRMNPYKWAEYKRNYKWVQKQMKKLGLNPEDIRWLL